MSGSPSETGEDRDSSAKKAPWFISWLLALGPSGPVGNGDLGHEAFPHLIEGECGEVVELAQGDATQEGILYRGAARACLAAFENRQGLWSQAENDLASFNPQTFEFTCYDRAVHKLFTTLIKYHRRDPARRFEKAGAKGTIRDSCPRLESLEPSSGPTEGGYEVSVLGKNLTGKVTLNIGYETEEPHPYQTQPDGNRLTFRMPSTNQSREVYIRVSFEGDESALPFSQEEDSPVDQEPEVESAQPESKSAQPNPGPEGESTEPNPEPSNRTSDEPSDDPS